MGPPGQEAPLGPEVGDRMADWRLQRQPSAILAFGGHPPWGPEVVWRAGARRSGDRRSEPDPGPTRRLQKSLVEL